MLRKTRTDKEYKKNMEQRIVEYLNAQSAFDKENKRNMVASWYGKIPGIPEKERKVVLRSLKYNLGKSLAVFFLVTFAVALIWSFGLTVFDPYTQVVGQPLLGNKTCTGIVESDDMVRFKDFNLLEHVSVSMEELGLSAYDMSEGERVNIYWERKDDDSKEYSVIYALPQKDADRIEAIYYGIFAAGFLANFIINIWVFWAKRKKYVGWYSDFYLRMEKFCNQAHVYNQFPGLFTEEAFMAYGNRYPDSIAIDFQRVQISNDDKKERRTKIFKPVGISLIVIVVIISVILLFTNFTYMKGEKADQARLGNVMQQFSDAENGKMQPLGEDSDYYNPMDMINLAKESFPGEEVFYKIVVKPDYIAVVITTQEKKAVYFNQYVPVEGKVGENDAVYELKLSMSSDAMLPSDVLENAQGSW